VFKTERELVAPAAEPEGEEAGTILEREIVPREEEPTAEPAGPVTMFESEIVEAPAPEPAVLAGVAAAAAAAAAERLAAGGVAAGRGGGEGKYQRTFTSAMPCGSAQIEMVFVAPFAASAGVLPEAKASFCVTGTPPTQAANNG